MSMKIQISAIAAWLALGSVLAALPLSHRAALGLWGGWGTGGAAGFVTLGLLGWTLRDGAPGIESALRAIVLGFVTRLGLLGVGLVLAVRLGGSALAFCGLFFAIYLACQAVEVAVATRPASLGAAR